MKKKNSSKNIRRIAHYGWLPDLPDHRDFLFGVRHPLKAALPSSVDLRPMCPPIVDQGQLGSCTANALAGALGFLEDKDKVPFAALSRLFIYYNERVIEGTVKTDSGAMIRDGIKSLANLGVCAETQWPYQISKFAMRPSTLCYKQALKHTITVYERLETLEDMRACLADGYPFVFGFTAYESLESQYVAQTGSVPLPAPDEQTIGGHAVVAVGYNDSGKHFIFRNSWGTSWGMEGYGLMPYAYLTNRNLSDDFWTVRRGGGL